MALQVRIFQNSCVPGNGRVADIDRDLAIRSVNNDIFQNFQHFQKKGLVVEGKLKGMPGIHADGENRALFSLFIFLIP